MTTPIVDQSSAKLPGVGTAGAAGGFLGYILTIIATTVKPGTQPEKFIMWSIPVITAATTWATFHFTRWRMFLTAVWLCKRAEKNKLATEQERKEAREQLSFLRKARRDRAVDKALRELHLENLPGRTAVPSQRDSQSSAEEQAVVSEE